MIRSTEAAVFNGRKLHPNHLDDLRRSGLTDATIEAAKLYSEHRHTEIGVSLNWAKPPKRLGSVLVFPFHRPDGAYTGYCRVKPDTPRVDKASGKPIKYESPRGRGNEIYFPPGIAAAIEDPTAPLVLTEGEKKALAATQEGFPCIGLVGIYGWKAKGSAALPPALAAIAWKGRTVYIAFDSDMADNENVATACAWLAAVLKAQGAEVRVVHFPHGPEGEDGKPAKTGLDDYLVSHGAGELHRLLNEATNADELESLELKLDAKHIDPATDATKFLETGKADDVYKLAFWNGEFYRWLHGRYAEVENAEVRGHAVRHLNLGYCRVGSRDVGNVMEHVKALTLLPGDMQAPCWLGKRPLLDGKPWPSDNVLVAKNGLVHLPSFVAGRDYFHPPTPRFFAHAALDYEFDAEARDPVLWLNFLHQLWPHDQASVSTLQEWCGLCLTLDTSYQKLLLLVGPKRSGKGTIARVLRNMIGLKNTASPTLAQFAERFGLWSLVGKPLAVVGDARLSGKADQAIIVERLLSITGEDGLDVDRKNLDLLKSYTFPTRLMLISNELPRLTDSSGALPGRIILLQMAESFYGQEDRTLTTRLLTELPQILRWSIEGWKRLTERERFAQPDSALETMQQLADLSSPTGTFVRDVCEVGPSLHVQCASLYGRWVGWCEAQGLPATSQPVFGKDLSAVVPGLQRHRPRDGEDRVWVYRGINIRHAVS